MFIPYVNCTFSLDTDPVTSSQGTRIRAMIHEWDMTAEHTCSCLYDEFKRSVDESECLDDAKQIVSLLNICQDDVARSKYPLQAHIYIRLACRLYIQSPEPSTHPTYIWDYNASHLTIYSTPGSFVRVTCIWNPPLNHWPKSRTYNAMWGLLVAEVSFPSCYFSLDPDSTHPPLGQGLWYWSQPMGCSNSEGLLGEGWLDNATEIEAREGVCLQSCAVQDHQQHARHWPWVIGISNRSLHYPNEWSGVKKATFYIILGRQGYPRWRGTQGSTWQVRGGWPSYKAECHQWNRDEEGELHAHWYVFHYPNASLALPQAV